MQLILKSQPTTNQSCIFHKIDMAPGSNAEAPNGKVQGTLFLLSMLGISIGKTHFIPSDLCTASPTNPEKERLRTDTLYLAHFISQLLSAAETRRRKRAIRSPPSCSMVLFSQKSMPFHLGG